MDSFEEVLVVSDSGRNNISCSFYDFKTLNLLRSYKGGSCPRNGLAFVGEDYVISAIENQPILKVWTLCERPQDTCMTCPGVVSALAVTSCGSYCLAGIDKSIYIWEVISGLILAKLDCHSKQITCLRLSSDGSHFISGGEDGIVLTWLLSGAIEDNDSTPDVRPRFTWVDHSGPITDIYIGDIGFYSQVVTASKDMSCRIYEFATGAPLVTIRLDYAVTALTRDKLETFLILGSVEGVIYRINLFSSDDVELHYDKMDTKFAFLGHSKEITCLSVSLSGKFLVSGSEDNICRVWDMTNFSCLKRITCAGAVTNVVVMLLPPGLDKEQRFYPQLSFIPFKRQFNQITGDVTSRIQPRTLSTFHLGSLDEFINSEILLNSPETTNPSKKRTETEIACSKINADLYAFCLGNKTLEIRCNEKSNSSLVSNENSV